MIITLTQLLENRNAHQNASFHSGKIHYLGESFSFKEFDEKYPIKFERVYMRDIRKYKGKPVDSRIIEK